MKTMVVSFWTLAAFIFVSDARAQQQNFDAVKIEVEPVQGNVYMLTGAGGNVTVQVGAGWRAYRRHAVCAHGAENSRGHPEVVR